MRHWIATISRAKAGAASPRFQPRAPLGLIPHARRKEAIMIARRPNILVIMTDEERYPPVYETADVRAFRRRELRGQEALRARGVEPHRHYAASTACVPSRACLFTGHYPTLHGVRATDGAAKSAFDPAMYWLDPDTVP